MATYGVSVYGNDVYGLTLPPTYISPDMTAQAVDYGSILVTWMAPSGTIYRYRLIGNRYGFPVNENDGQILIDSDTYPGSSYLHQQIIPGVQYYYGIYVLVDAEENTWLRSAVTSCLAVKNFGSSDWLFDSLPEYFRTLPSGGELGGPKAGNTYLNQFMGILGWGFDYVKTQYAQLANDLYDAERIPENLLYNLAAQLGMSFSPETDPQTVRKAVLNFSHVAREKGTTLGLQNEVTLFTGWGVDAQPGPNIMLDDSQSEFLAPVFLPYEPTRNYVAGELVWYDGTGVAPDAFAWTGLGYWYKCLEATHGIAPTGTNSSNANWQVVNDANDWLYTLVLPRTSNPSTWEALNPSNVQGTVPINTLIEGLGVQRPTFEGEGYQAWNSLRIINQAGTAQTLWARSVSRSNAALSHIPDPSFESGFTVVSGTVTNQTWIPDTWPIVLSAVSGFPNQTFNSAQFWTAENATLTRSQAEANSGTWALKVAANSAAALAVYSPWVPVTPGVQYTAANFVYPVATLGSTVLTGIVWLDSNGAELSESDGSATAPTEGTWVSKNAAGKTAPAGARYAYLKFAYTGNAGAGDVFYLDDCTIVPVTSSDTVFAADHLQAIGDGIPVPWVRDSQTWDPGTSYSTGDIVLWRGQVFGAVRASTGAEPPDLNAASPEWQPLSFDRRVRLLASGYTSQDLSVVTDEAVAVTPFVEWYDQGGNFISRVFARNPLGNSTPARPDSLTFDSFTTPSSAFKGTVETGPWEAKFYNGINLTGGVVLERTDQEVNFAWDSTSPGPGVDSTGWSASWTTSFVAPATATYTFGVSSSDGSRILVNGTEVVNNWRDQPMTDMSGTITLDANTVVNIEVDYYKDVVEPEAWTTTITTFDNRTDAHGWFSGVTSDSHWDPGVPALVSGNQATTAEGDSITILPLPEFEPTVVDGVTVPFTFTHGILFGGSEVEIHTNTDVADEFIRRVFYGPTFPVTPGTNVVAGAWSIDRGPGVTAYIQWIGEHGTPVDFTELPSATAEIPGTLGVAVGTEPNYVDLNQPHWTLATVSGTAPPGTKYAMLLIREWWISPLDAADDLHPLMGPAFVSTQPLENQEPSGLVLDPVTWTTSGTSPSLDGRITDDRQNNWTVTTGEFLQFDYLDGVVAPEDPTARSIALTSGPANGNIGVTFSSDAPSGSNQELVFRYSDDNNYWAANRLGLSKKVSGGWLGLGSFSTPFSDGDRMVVNLNSSVITVYRNGVSVLTVTDTFNDTATQHGIACEPLIISGTGLYGAGYYGEGVYGG